MFRSLKAQLIFSLTLIIFLFIGQQYVSYQSQNLLVTGITSNQKVAEGVIQVKILEKDVLNLQRNVLIYKETQATAVLKRLDDIMISVNTKLDMTTALIKKNNIGTNQEDTIESMRNHLKDYRENFDSVVLLINKKSELFNVKIVTQLSHIKKISSEGSDAITSKKIGNQKYESNNKLNALTSELQLAAYQYLLLPNAENITHFQETSEKLKSVVMPLNIPELNKKLATLSSDFRLLTQVTRNYNYLVNVVMSGAANEFLYLAKSLSEGVLQHLNSSNSDLNTIVDESIFRGSIMFVLGIFLTSVITLYVLKKIILPIQKVTQVFDILASNKELKEQLDINRSDEIGQLMKSATIFQQKNQQTNTLLIESQQLTNNLQYHNKKLKKQPKQKVCF